MSQFVNKTAIITGAASGIGFQIAKHLCAEGASVMISDYNEELCHQAVAKIKQNQPHAKVAFSLGDASDVAYIYKLVEQTEQTFGAIHHIIANAGTTLFGAFLEFTEESFQKVMNLNLKGSFFLIQAFAKQCIKNKIKGSIVLMSSNIGGLAYPNLSAYSISKAGLRMMSKNLIAELSPLGIRINTVAPGATLTERTAVEEADYWGVWSAITPLNQIAKPEDIADATLFLLSENAQHITGQTLVVDGGWESTGRRPNT